MDNLRILVRKRALLLFCFLFLSTLIFLPQLTLSASKSVSQGSTDFANGVFSTGAELDSGSGKIGLKQSGTVQNLDLSAIPNSQKYNTGYSNNKIKLKKNYHHPLTQNPQYNQNYDTSIFFNGNYMYVTSWYDGIYVVDTKGTVDPVDDELVIKYNTSSTPAIPHNEIEYGFIEGQVIYFCTDGGLTMFDTKGTTNPSDDTLIYNFSNTSSLPILSRYIRYAFVENNILYIAQNDGNQLGASADGVSIINLGANLLSSADDSLIKNYNSTSTPALSGNWVKHIEKVGNYLLVSDYVGLTVLNLGDVLNLTDDSISQVYTEWTIPEHIGAGVSYTKYTNGVLFFVYSAGTILMDIGDFATKTDDVIIKEFSESSAPSLPQSGNIWNIFVDGTKVYLSNSQDGLHAFDLHDFKNPNDDELVAMYNGTSDPALLYGCATYSIVHNGFLYVLSWEGGLDILNPSGYFSEGSIIGNNEKIPQNQKVKISSTKNGSQKVSLKTKTGGAGPITTNNFDDNIADEYVNDAGWATNTYFQTKVESNGTLKLSDPVSKVAYNNLDDRVTFWIDANPGGGEQMAKSTVKVKMRLNSNTATAPSFDDYLFYEDWNWNDSGPFKFVNNEWKEVTFSPNESFRYIGFDVYWGKGTWGIGDSLEIDYVQIQEPVLTQAIAFDDGNPNQYITDIYNWGNTFQNVSEVGGNLILTNPTPNNPGRWDPTMEFVYAFLPTGKPALYYPVGTSIKVRFRINSSTYANKSPQNNGIYTDDWSSGDEASLPTLVPNQWYETTFAAVFGKFSNIGFQLYWNTGTWAPGDSLEIDYINIYEPFVWGSWSSWCEAETCDISDAAGKTDFQYQVKLETTDPASTPEVNYIQLGESSYPASGTFTSPVITGDAESDWQTLTSTSSAPPGTTISFETRSGDSATPDGTWSDWGAVDGSNNIASADSNYLQYQATLTTTDTAITPTLDTVVVSWNDVAQPTDPPSGGGDTPPAGNNGGTTGESNTPTGGSDTPAGGGVVAITEGGTGATKDNNPIEIVSGTAGEGSAAENGGSTDINTVTDKDDNTQADKNEDKTKIPWFGLASFLCLFSACSMGIRRFYPRFSRFFESLGTLFVARSKKKRWGIVYNSITGKPISGANVSLFETHFNQLAESKVTDQHGRFIINATPGEYYIMVTKEDYKFPSGFDLTAYRGKKFNVDNEESLILLDIPIDPLGKKAGIRMFSFDSIKHLIDLIYYPVLIGGSVFSIVAALTIRTLPSYLILVLYLLLWIYEAILFLSEKTYGEIYDPVRKKPVDAATIRVFDAKTQKLVETKVTNMKGRFNLLLSPGQYIVVIIKEGAKTLVKSVSVKSDKYLNETYYVS